VDALRRVWAPVFEAKTVNHAMGKAFADRWGRAYDCSQVSPPCAADFAAHLAVVRDSAPGGDGLPYAAWKHAGIAGATTLAAVEGWMREGNPMPIEFNESVTVFLPKGESENDHIDCTRSAENLRPLGLKNSDNKVVCGVLNRRLRSSISRGACSLQRGFVGGRQMVQNVIDLDAAARCAGVRAFAAWLPALLFWDFAAAFPSVGHGWIWEVLRVAKLPAGFVNVLRSLYKLNAAMVAGSGGISFFCWVMSGVLQGCPLSGLIFVLVMDPLLSAMEGLIDKVGLATTRACADDVGAAVVHIRALKIYANLFSIMERVSNLRLKASKCVVVPVATKFCPAIVELFRNWLAANLPGWARFAISAEGKYLGFLLGPGAGASSWRAPLQKWMHRVLCLAGSHLAPSLGTADFNARIVSTLGYVAQLLPPPEVLWALELNAANKILHAPGRALCCGLLSNLDQLGMVAFRSSAGACVSALIRTAVSGKLQWAGAWHDMMTSAEEHLPFAHVVKEEPWGRHWAAPAFAAHLRLAAAGRAPLGLPRRAHAPFGAAVAAALAALGADAAAKTQAVAYSSFMRERFSCDVDGLLGAKFCRLFGVSAAVGFGGVIRASLAKLSPQCAAFALRTLVNAWPTAHRMHSDPLPCLFGCLGDGCRDSLSHYIGCLPLLDSVRRALGHSAVESPLHERFGFFPPLRAEPLTCAIICDVYLTFRGLATEEVYVVVAAARLRNVATAVVNKHRANLRRPPNLEILRRPPNPAIIGIACPLRAPAPPMGGVGSHHPDP
jgi:hypothetical protein